MELGGVIIKIQGNKKGSDKSEPFQYLGQIIQ